MQELLKNKLHEYLRLNNPDLLLSLEETNSVTAFLSIKVSAVNDQIAQLQKEHTPAYIIEDICMDELTKEFRPSKYNYISNVLEEDFEFAYLQFQKSGILPYELINIINQCEPAFETFSFKDDTEDKRELRYAVTGIIDKYLTK